MISAGLLSTEHRRLKVRWIEQARASKFVRLWGVGVGGPSANQSACLQARSLFLFWRTGPQSKVENSKGRSKS